ncbi:universal stress protein [Nocardia australiensis]|uniref:universal stress protein n=1 Tax=Nocardia australiensis TaxID=2887191 RepID=UPI001D14ECF5|nr:universal stress protein [Nocardia australiensis]
MGNSSAPQIIAAVDGSASSYQAVAWAAVDAALHHCRLRIVTSVAIPDFGPDRTLAESDIEWLRRNGERILAEATLVAHQAALGEELELATEVMFVSIIPTLILRSARARMLVVGTSGVGAFQRGLLGSVGTALTHHAHCPVAVIHENSALDPVSVGKPVLVGVDGSENSVPAIELAFEEASRREVGLTALHTWSDASGIDLPHSGWEAARESEQTRLAEHMAGYRDRYPDVPVLRILKLDKPVRALLDASANAQLLVVGSHGRGGFASMMLGSTSKALLHTVECPMIVVHKA